MLEKDRNRFTLRSAPLLPVLMQKKLPDGCVPLLVPLVLDSHVSTGIYITPTTFFYPIPEPLFPLYNTHSLLFSDTQLFIFSRGAKTPKALVDRTLSSSQIRLDNNYLHYLNPLISQLRQLTHLDLSNNGLKLLPPEIGRPC